MSHNSPLRYFMYARKSSETEDRQTQSIETQITRLRELQQRKNLPVVGEPLTEACSAREPGKRPVFNQMLERIKRGEANGILTWHISRLSRNPVDSAQISWLLQTGVIQSIETPERPYLPNDNVLFMALEGAMANQYLLDLSRNVKSGMLRRVEKGILPNKCALGYRNVQIDNEHIIVKDDQRFDLIKKMWDMVLSESHTPAKVLEIANTMWGLKTRKTKHGGDKTLSRSTIYKILSNPFYMGLIQFNGKLYQGNHVAMVTPQEYDQVQIILGKKTQARPKKHSFPFTGTMICGECRGAITAETKVRFSKKQNRNLVHCYYHCGHQKKHVTCHQRGGISSEELEAMIDEKLRKSTILPEFTAWALSVLQDRHQLEIDTSNSLYENQQKALLDLEKQRGNLLQMKMKAQISDDDFTTLRNQINTEVNRLRVAVSNTEHKADNWLENAEKVFFFARDAHEAFATGDDHRKKEILLSLGYNIILKDKKLNIDANEWLVPIQNDYPALEKEHIRLEQSDCNDDNKKEALALTHTKWLGDRDSNPNKQIQSLLSYHWTIPQE